MIRDILESLYFWSGEMTIYRGGGNPRYYEPNNGMYGTWGEGIYFDIHEDEASLYGKVKTYTFKGKLVEAEADENIPDSTMDKILKDLKIEREDIDLSGRFWAQVQAIVRYYHKNNGKREKAFTVIKKHTGAGGFVGGSHEIVLFLAKDAKLKKK